MLYLFDVTILSQLNYKVILTKDDEYVTFDDCHRFDLGYAAEQGD